MEADHTIAPDKGPKWGALRFRDFRRYWLGYVFSVSGQQMQWVAQAWLIYELSGSKLLLGANALAQALPATMLALLGGVVADKVDQRRLLIGVQLLQGALMAVLAALCFTQVVQVWHIMATVSMLAVVGAFQHPAQQAMFPHLVPRQSLTGAVALNSTIHPGTRILGPILAGVVLAEVVDATSSVMVAAGAIFSITAAGFIAYAFFLLFIYMPPVRRSFGKMPQEMVMGLQFIWRNRIFAFLIGMTYFTMFFGLSLSILYPVIAKDILGVGPSGLGLMYAAFGVGSLLGAVGASAAVGLLGRRLVIVGGSAALGVFIVLFAVSTWYPLSLLFLALAGTGSAVYSVAVQSALQLLVPDALRGRVMGIHGMTHSGVRPFGEMQLSGVATLITAPFALLLGGALVVAFALLVAAPSRLLREIAVSAAPERSSAEKGRSP